VRRRLLAGAALSIASVSVAFAQGEPDVRAPVNAVRTLGFDYSYANFQGEIDAWHIGAVSVASKTSNGTFIGRLNLARRFAINGAQAEVDAYPTLGAGRYAFFNLGYSPSDIFPDWRSGAEIFQSLPRAYEASLGYRQLRFDGSPVTLFTGAVGRYTGNYWFSLRPYIRAKDSGLATTVTLTARRYGADAENYIGARAGFGSSPSEDIQFSQLARTSSASATINASRSTPGKPTTTWSVGLEREELSPGRFRNKWEIGGGLRFPF
jgi:YaiO family outer membrane protein